MRSFTTIPAASITTGTPSMYFIQGNLFVMDAVQAGTILLNYFCKPNKIVSETENIFVPDEDAEILTLYMLQRVLGKLRDWNGVSEIESQYRDAIRHVVPIKQSQELETLWAQGGGYD